MVSKEEYLAKVHLDAWKFREDKRKEAYSGKISKEDLWMFKKQEEMCDGE